MIRYLTALSILAASAVSAAELVVRDVDAAVTVMPAAFAYTMTSPTVSRTGNDSFTSGTELTCGGRYALARPGDALGLVGGADLISDTWTYGSGSFLFATGLRASAGLGWAISDRWTLLAEPGFRYGVSSFTVASSSSAQSYKASGTFSGFDGRVTAMWQLSKDVQLEAHGGWLSMKHQQSDGDISQTIDQKGLYVGIGVVWRWSTAPTRIE